MQAIEEAVQTAQRSSSDIALTYAGYALGVALLYRDAGDDRDHGLELTVQAREWQRERVPFLVPVTEALVARERARRGDRDAVIPGMRKAVDGLHQEGQLGYGVWGTGVLVETLLDGGTEGDLAEAKAAIDWLADLPETTGRRSSRSRCCGCARC